MSSASRRASTAADVTFVPDGPARYRIPRRGAMRVDAVFYATAPLLETLEREGHASLVQLMQVAALPGIQAPALAMPDIHPGYGFPIGGVAAFDPALGGVVSPGGVGYDIHCGVRLLASDLVERDLTGRRERLADALAAFVPAGLGSSRAGTRLDDAQLDGVLTRGAAWVVARGGGEEDDLRRLESGGVIPGADPARVSDRARRRGADQLGTLGSGNHFLEVQVVDAVYHPGAAAALGLAVGMLTVLVHTGSRGLGHQVCSDALDTFVDAARRYGVALPDPQLAAAPIRSPEADAYLAAMAAAANFACANRQSLTCAARAAFEAAGFGPRDHALRVVTEVAHNHAAWERHGGRRLLVHRKGATRALPPGHPDVPEPIRPFGQPVLVPGDMGRASYVLLGTRHGMDHAFGSCCHGAGRRLSRHRAKRETRGRDLEAELRSVGVTVRAATRATVAEEMPEAYKDVADVVAAVEEGGLAVPVARLRPRIVVKG